VGSAASLPHSRPAAATRAIRRAALAPIVLYQRMISPAIPRRCKYEPTCSRYAVEAISRYGVLRGMVLAGWRLLRCNPFSYGGYDPVDAQRLFQRARRRARERESTEPAGSPPR
jgi:putative membrane protein insertion efficiency factor